MRKLFLTLMLSVLTIGCNDPKNLVIPREGSEMNEFSAKVKNLNAEEKYLLNSYLDYYSEENLVPVGITVGEAIEDERKLKKEYGSYNPPK